MKDTKRTFQMLVSAGLPPRSAGSQARFLRRGGSMRLFGLVAAASCVVGLSAWTVATARGADSSSPPSEVQTEPAQATANGFALRGRLNPGGLPTSYYFEYSANGCDELRSCLMRTAVGGPLTGEAQQEVPAVEVTGLIAGETYSYRLVASNADGSPEGGLFLTFTVAESVFTAPPEGHSGSSGPSGAEPLSETLTPLVVAPVATVTIGTTKPAPAAAARRFARAMRECQRKPKRQRMLCDRRAHWKYGIEAKRTGSRAGSGKR